MTMKVIYRILDIKVEVENRENLNKHKAFILVANHQSSIDFIGNYLAQDKPGKEFMFKL